MSLASIRFPFERGARYSLAALRSFESDLAALRSNDIKFSLELRLNHLEWAKLRNEELAPFLLFADSLSLPGELQFEVFEQGHPGADIELLGRTDATLGFQITVADPSWNKNGSRTVSLQNQMLALGQIAWGGGGTRKVRHAEEVESVPRAVEQEQRRNACRDAMKIALERKCTTSAVSDCLIVYARGHGFELLDEGFESELGPVIENAKYRLMEKGYRATYAVDQLFQRPICVGFEDENFASCLRSLKG